MNASAYESLISEADQLSFNFVLNEVEAAQIFLQLYDTEISKPPDEQGAALSLWNAGLALDIARRFLPRLDGDARARLDLRLAELETALKEREAEYASIQSVGN